MLMDRKKITPERFQFDKLSTTNINEKDSRFQIKIKKCCSIGINKTNSNFFLCVVLNVQSFV